MSKQIMKLELKISNKQSDSFSSKVGGMAELMSSEPYPTINSRYCRFLIQLNFAEFEDKSDSLPKSGLLQIFHGSISQSEILAIYRDKEIPLTKKEIPDKLNYNGDSDYQFIEERKLLHTLESDFKNVKILKTEIVDKTSVYLQMTNNEELETNILQINSDGIEYFGQKTGNANFKDLLASEENCFQMGQLNWDQWKKKLIEFDKNKIKHISQFNDLVCLVSIPTNFENYMIFGDSYRVEIYIFNNDLIKKDFSKIKIKYSH